MIPIRRSAGSLRRGVAVRFGGTRAHLVRSDSIFGTEMFCGKPGYVAAAARGPVCEPCKTEARRVGYDI